MSKTLYNLVLSVRTRKQIRSSEVFKEKYHMPFTKPNLQGLVKRRNESNLGLVKTNISYIRKYTL